MSRCWKAVCVALISATIGSLSGAEPLRVWPDGTPEQIREDVFGVRFRQIREIDGAKAGLAFLRKEFERSPRPAVKAYYGWVSLFAEGWGYPEMKDTARGLTLCEEAKKEGSLVARDVLARAKGLGVGGPADATGAAELLAEAAAGGATRSMARLGYYHAIGYGVPVNQVEADRLVRRAAELGQPFGLVEIGQAYEAGAIGGKADLARAMEYYYEASCHAETEAWKKLLELEKKNLPQAKLYHALGYVREANRAAWIAPTRVREQVRTLTELAGDHPQAMVELGRAHLDGVYAKKDYKLARECLDRAAAKGNGDAQFLLAKMSLRGWGETARPAEALAAIHQLAERGSAEAANYLGFLYYWAPGEAPGLVKSPEKAFAYVRQAAALGHPFALVNLGFCYEHGIGTPENYALATKVYWQAYLRGFTEGRNRVRKLMAFVKDE